jgi:hypothetical protein
MGTNVVIKVRANLRNLYNRVLEAYQRSKITGTYGDLIVPDDVLQQKPERLIATPENMGEKTMEEILRGYPVKKIIQTGPKSVEILVEDNIIYIGKLSEAIKNWDNRARIQLGDRYEEPTQEPKRVAPVTVQEPKIAPIEEHEKKTPTYFADFA